MDLSMAGGWVDRRGRSVVLDPAVGDVATHAGLTGHGRVSGMSLQIASVGGPGVVVADLGENPCAGESGQAEEARDDLGVGMLQKQLFCVGCQVVACLAGGVELG
nr:hypothetical protein [Streptomyces humi]